MPEATLRQTDSPQLSGGYSEIHVTLAAITIRVHEKGLVLGPPYEV